MSDHPICRQRARGSIALAWVCDVCAHNGTLHPGRHNPGVDGCLACTVDVLVRLRLTRELPTRASSVEVPHLTTSDRESHDAGDDDR